MTTTQIDTLNDTFDELDRAIETNDRSAALIALSFARRLCCSAWRTLAADKKHITDSALRLAATFTGFSEQTILGNSRPEPVAEARHLAFYLARHANPVPHQLSYPEIAARYGRDHGTIMNGVNRIKEKIETYPESRLARELPSLLKQMPSS